MAELRWMIDGDEIHLNPENEKQNVSIFTNMNPWERGILELGLNLIQDHLEIAKMNVMVAEAVEAKRPGSDASFGPWPE